MNKKTFLSLSLAVLFALPSFAQQPKYIFYFIGDGMGLNHVNLSEVYQSDLKNEIGNTALIFSQFPFATFATSHSQSNGVTDSAAGGSALAVGKKTKNGVISMDSTGTIPYKSIAYAAKEKGMKVGVTTSVSIDHATPASFYSNQSNRNKYYEIANDITKSNFDFFGGSGFINPTKTYDKKDAPAIEGVLTNAGYTIVKGRKGYNNEKDKNKKIILINDDVTNSGSLKYAIDQEPNDMNLADITQSAIESLSSSKAGFFLMVEGGKIDWSSHANDAATTVKEVLDFNKSVQLAYDFYKKHPKETLIVVTADHETGGLILGNGSSTLKTRNLSSQKSSQEILSKKIGKLRTDKPNASWDDVKGLLAENLGLWTAIKINEKEESLLKDAYKKSFIDHQNETSKSLYANDDKIASLAVGILNKLSSVSWASGSHSAAYIPVYAIGAGAESFNHKMDNTDIPKKIAEAAGLNL
ncbi:alkaline phosphatase [Sphingobacterium rhinopitheci]|uniref:alkaline phosphatase n=1 Tax=Sphingobacterium rhinopitheci TaxID=2781960 RepID=UPI001F519AF1|nr:alkaline phosphatase [Sphingobacterium rhinopitheci]MCI0922119.1 alkaline phosphatase [Sphingobacterium rhinopitheci]